MPIRGTENTTKSQSELKGKTRKPPKTRENVGDQVMIVKNVTRVFWPNQRAKESETNASPDHFRQ